MNLKPTGDQKQQTLLFIFFLPFLQCPGRQQLQWRQLQTTTVMTVKWTLFITCSTLLSRGPLQPHTVSFITPWQLQCGRIVSSCVNRHLLHLLLASLHLQEKTKCLCGRIFYPGTDPCRLTSLFQLRKIDLSCLRGIKLWGQCRCLINWDIHSGLGGKMQEKCHWSY